MKVETKIEMRSSLDVAWSIITDFKNYKKWNPFIRLVVGVPSLNSNHLMFAKIKKPILKYFPIVFFCKITKFKINSSLEWEGVLFHRSIFKGRHFFYLEKKDNLNMLLIHGEEYSGILKFIITPLISCKESFVSMNVAIKNQIEN